MSTDAENSLATRAHEELDVCCETVCDKKYVLDYIEHLEDKLKKYEDQLNNEGVI